MPKVVDIFLKSGEGGDVDVIYIHSDLVASMFDGKKQSPKVSHIRFDEETQEFFAILGDGREIARNKERDKVVADEAAFINEMFARNDWIPGGFLSSPCHIHDGAVIPYGAKYLGRFPERSAPESTFDLYSTEAGNPFVIDRHRRVFVRNMLKGFESLSMLYTPHYTDETPESLALNEAVRRDMVETRILNEEWKVERNHKKEAHA